WKLSFDTYNREIERYHEVIEETESFFFFDSDCAVSLMSAILEQQDPENLRWLVALRNVDWLLSDAGITLEKKYSLMDTLCNAFFIEFGGNKSLKVVLDAKFRANKVSIENALAIYREMPAYRIFDASFKARS